MTPPLQKRATIIGLPYQGTHLAFGNWESDNAVDLATPAGTPVYAVASGTIGSQFGAIDSTDPHLQGLRLHLEAAGDEFYYAHLSKFAAGIAPGVHVEEGQLLGYSGVANGVAHLHFASSSGSPLSNIVGATATMIRAALARASSHGITETAAAAGGGGGSVASRIGDAARSAAGGVNSAARQAVPGVAAAENIAGAVGDAKDAVGGVKDIAGFLGKLTDPGFWLRALQIVAGAALAGSGLLLLARQVGLSVPHPPAVVPVPV